MSIEPVLRTHVGRDLPATIADSTIPFRVDGKADDATYQWETPLRVVITQPKFTIELPAGRFATLNSYAGRVVGMTVCPQLEAVDRSTLGDHVGSLRKQLHKAGWVLDRESPDGFAIWIDRMTSATGPRDATIVTHIAGAVRVHIRVGCVIRAVESTDGSPDRFIVSLDFTSDVIRNPIRQEMIDARIRENGDRSKRLPLSYWLGRVTGSSNVKEES